jgi:hypothetical protein
MVGELAHFTFCDTEHLGDFGKRTPRLGRGEAADHRRVRGAMLFEDEGHAFVLPVVREVEVNVRQLVQRHALLVQEAPKVEVEADGAHVRDVEAVANERIRRAPTGNPLDAAPPTLLQEVPDHEEVCFVADLGDDG